MTFSSDACVWTPAECLWYAYCCVDLPPPHHGLGTVLSWYLWNERAVPSNTADTFHQGIVIQVLK